MEELHPKVSVIIPVYNCEKYIREAIESVLAQTYKDFELIVVDDGSTDNSGRIVRKEFGQAARYQYQPNGGAAKARYAGVKCSSGEYLAFLDLWVPEKLATQVSILDTKPEIGVVHCAIGIIDSAGQHVKIWNTCESNDVYARQFRKAHLIYPDAALIRRQIFLKAGGFDEEFPAAAYEDLEFFIRLRQLCEIYCVEKSLVRVRYWGSARHDEGRALQNRAILLQKLIKQFSNDPAHKRFLSSEQARWCSDMENSW